jgi:FkbM family methyltransferase
MRGVGRLKRILGQTSDRRSPVLRSLAALKMAEQPLLVVDIGALGGLLPELAPIEGFVQAVGFDPDPDECERLNAAARERGLDHRFLPYAVTGSDGRRSFQVLRKEASSSLLPPNREYHDRFPEAERMDVMRTVEVETRALGSVLAAEEICPELLKLDAHGVEGQILESLHDEHWGGLLAVHVELMLAEHYLGQNPVGAVHDRLREHDLELYSLKRYASRRAGFDTGRYRSRGQLAFADALYLRQASRLDRPEQRRLAVIAAAFRHYDFALELLADDEAARSVVLSLARRKRRDGASTQPWSSDGTGDWI